MNGQLRSQERIELGKERIVAVQHIIERGNRYRLGTAVAQEAAERVDMSRWAMQGQHARRGRRAERGDHPEAVMRLGQHGGIAALEAGADLPVFRSAGARMDVVENDPGALA